MLVSLIIVNYNTGDILEDCIESVFKHENEIEFEIIIVDNNSIDSSGKIIERIAEQRRNVSAIFSDSKISFSEANNRGFDRSSGEYVLIMNPDIIFTEPVLKKLICDLKNDKKLGAVCPLLLGTDCKFQSMYFQKYPTLMQFFFYYSIAGSIFQNNEKLKNRYLKSGNIHVESKKIEYVPQIPCAFFLTSRNIFESAGKMDSDYFLFFEDVDLSFQINKNFKLGIDTSLQVTHLGGASFKKSDDYWLYGRFIIGMINFFSKNYGPGKTFILKTSAALNSRIIVLTERIKKIFGKEDDYRLRKHVFFLNELKKQTDKI